MKKHRGLKGVYVDLWISDPIILVDVIWAVRCLGSSEGMIASVKGCLAREEL
ncbi:hypothetical protein TanjilG_07758 [Lupinus angustifolius]|uniref:Uncharacterized protein n=1 Tax=Lupinus angustifolius TaxID=3871 RepID=A0A1J7HIH4_LUPAN|nr:hypothetical protein TanjilG_07758 [Lupinus angustifolius]